MDVTFADGSTERYEDKPFAHGAQGEIYRSSDNAHVLKLYHPKHGTPEYAQQLDQIINQYNPTDGNSYWKEVLIWPQKRAVSPRLGARMRFVPDMVRLDHLMYRAAYEALPPAKRGNWLGRVAIALKLARAVDRLANRGICHSDLSDRNVLVDAAEGRIALLDGDGVVIPGIIPAKVLGSREYMAPELVSGSVQAPSLLTDCHSLAVLLYRLLTYKHPLLGPKRCSSDPDVDERLALGEQALYIEHPTDPSNRPAGMRNTAEMLGPPLRDLFLRAFVDGLHAPEKRPVPYEWLDPLTELWDIMLPCSNPACVQGYFVAPSSGPLVCTNCETRVEAPEWIPHFEISPPAAGGYDSTIPAPSHMLGWQGRILYPWHIRSQPASDTFFDAAPYAEIVFDSRERAWYLENLRISDLHGGRDRDGQINWQPIPLHARLRLRPGVRLRFGTENATAEVVVDRRETGSSDGPRAPAPLPEITSGAGQWPTIISGVERPVTFDNVSEHQDSLSQLLSLPVYLMVENSRFVQGSALASIRSVIELVCRELAANAATVDVARVSAITFGDRVEQTAPVPVSRFSIPALAPHGPSQLGEALALLNETLERELLPQLSAQRVGYKPLVIIVTTARPSDHWQAQVERLISRADELTIIPISIGSLGISEMFRRLGRAPLAAEHVTGPALRDAWKASTYIEWQGQNAFRAEAQQ